MTGSKSFTIRKGSNERSATQYTTFTSIHGITAYRQRNAHRRGALPVNRNIHALKRHRYSVWPAGRTIRRELVRYDQRIVDPIGAELNVRLPSCIASWVALTMSSLPGQHKPIGTTFDGDRALGVGPYGYTWDTQDGCFLLNTTGVGENHLSARHQSEKFEIPQRSTFIGSQSTSERWIRSRVRGCTGNNNGLLRDLRQCSTDLRQNLQIVDVGGTMPG